MTETIPTLKLDAEPLIMGKVEFDGENSTGLAERYEYAYEDRVLPLKFLRDTDTRGRSCKKLVPERGKDVDEVEDKDEDKDEDQGEEEEDEYGDSDSDSDFTDGGQGVAELGPTQPTLPKGRLVLDRDHESFKEEGREDEQVELVVEEPLDGVRAVSGFSNTKHGDSTLRGLITPEGLLYLYKAEDVVDATRESASAGRRKKSNTAASRRAKLTKPPSMHWSVPKETFNLRPQHISGRSSSLEWTVEKAILELYTNFLDQAQVTSKEIFPVDTPPVEHYIIRRKCGWVTETFFAADVKLAEMEYRKKDAKWVRSFAKPSTKYEPSDVVGPCPAWVLTFKNFGAHIKSQCFLRGVSGAEKEGNPDVVGKYGDGLNQGIDTLVRRGVNFSMLTAGFTTTGILDWEQHSHTQHKTNHQTERKVVTTLTFMPNQPHLLQNYRRQYTAHHYDPFDPETFDPTGMNLPDNADRVSVHVDGPETAPSAILLGKDMRGKKFARGMPVCDDGDVCLFGYSLADPGRKLVQGRDRCAMNSKLTRPALDKLVCAGIEKSSRLRRKLVMALTSRYFFHDHYEDIRPKKWSARAVELIQQESRIMFEGRILLHRPSPRKEKIAGFRNLKPYSCHPALDEGKALEDDFVQELRSLPREEIDDQDGAAACRGWASNAREELLELTGATSVVSVEFPGKLGAEHVVWVLEDVVLISRKSLKVDLKKESVETAMVLMDNLSCSMDRDTNSSHQSGLPFKVYHLISRVDHYPEASTSAVVVTGASSDGGAQVLPAGDEENAGPEVAPDAIVSAPTTAAGIAQEQANPEATAEEPGPAGDGENAGAEVAPDGPLYDSSAAVAIADGQANPEATAEESDPAVDEENAGPEVAPDAVLSAPTTAATIAQEQANPEATAEETGPAGDGENVEAEVAPNGPLYDSLAAAAVGEERATPEATADERGPAVDGEKAGPEVAPSSAISAPTTSAAIAQEQENPGAMTEEIGDESNGDDEEGMEEGEPQDSEERPLFGGKRGCDTTEATAKRHKASESEGDGGASGEAPPPKLAQIAPVAEKAAEMPAVSVKLEESASSVGGAFASVKLEEPRSSEGAAATVLEPVQPGRSDEVVLGSAGREPGGGGRGEPFGATVTTTTCADCGA